MENKQPIGFVPSFSNPDRRALPHQTPDLVHLLIRHRDAPLRPIALQPDPIPQTVDHDVAAGVHSSAISSSVTAMHPCVQSPSSRTPSRRPWIMMSPPASTPASRARATSAVSGYEIRSDKLYLLRAFRRPMVYRPSGVRPSPSWRLGPSGAGPSAIR